MNRPRAEKSVATENDGVDQPRNVQSIADSMTEPALVGFRYTGSHYGEDAWIICDQDDLISP